MNSYSFDAAAMINAAIEWIRNWFDENGRNMNVVIGISGGKDSTVSAALLAKALGPDRVIGVAMPQGSQSINEADEICKYFGIRYMCVNVGEACAAVQKSIAESGLELSKNSVLNIPPRIRMTTLYAIAQTECAFVVNTCNLSEDYVGYATKFGDGAGDFSIFADLTVTEILAIGDYLGVPAKWVHKTPDDGLPHSCSDEQKFGFTYAELDRYIREDIIPEGNVEGKDELKITKIRNMRKWNLHKLRPMPKFNPNIAVNG